MSAQFAHPAQPAAAGAAAVTALSRSTAIAQAAIMDRLDTAVGRRPTRADPRGHYPATDTFLAATSRHLGAAVAVLVPAAQRHLDDGAGRGHDLAHACRRAEEALALVKGRLYGNAYAIRTPWREVWQEARAALEAAFAVERELTGALAGALDPTQASHLIDRLYAAEQHAPTRPHPFVPHTGWTGRAARGVARRVDAFWDATEGRMLPEPVRSRDRTRQGLLTQYLLADPHFADDLPDEPGTPGVPAPRSES